MTTTVATHSKDGTNTEPAAGDAFGQMLLAAQVRGGMATHVFEVTERDDGHVSVRDAYFYFMPVTGGWEHTLLSGLSGRVLDVGCGAGRHSAFLAGRGVTALGLDISEGAVAVCAERGVDAIEGDIRQPMSIGSFDAFLLLGGNLGLLGSPDHARELLNRLGAMSNPGARILASGIDLTLTDDPVHLAYQDANIAAGLHPCQVRMRVRHRNLATSWTDLWFPTPAEIAELVEGTEWTLAKIHHDEGTAGFYAVLTWDGPAAAGPADDR